MASAPPPPAPPLSAELFSRLLGRLLPQNSTSNIKGDCNLGSVKETEEQPDQEKCQQQQLSPKDVATEISKQFEYCLPHTHGESELHNAAFNGDALRLRLLLEYIESQPTKLITLNQRNRLGCTPARLAATGGHSECLRMLLKAGSDVNVVDVKGQTPLFVAVKNRRLDCSKMLLDFGASPAGDSRNSSRPLYIAFMNGDLQHVLVLLNNGAHPDKLCHVPPSLVTSTNPAENTTMPFLSSRRARLNTIGAAMTYLPRDDFYPAVKALLEKGCRTDNVLYHHCIDWNSVTLIKLLYAFGCRTDLRDDNGRLATELMFQNEAKQCLCSLRDNPRTLLSACRLAIISCLPRPRPSLECVQLLPLPAPLIDYLKFSDV